jgi:molecular chaperone GrpE
MVEEHKKHEDNDSEAHDKTLAVAQENELHEQPIDDSLVEISQKLEEEAKSLKDLVLREKAENENLRKRYIKELEDTNKYAITNFARDLIEVQENMHRALENISSEEIEKNPNIKNIVNGIELTKNSLATTFEKYGINRIYPIDQLFDHNYHQAIVQIPTSEKPEGTIVQVIQAGYTIKDRLLRPALVAVAKTS